MRGKMLVVMAVDGGTRRHLSQLTMDVIER